MKTVSFIVKFFRYHEITVFNIYGQSEPTEKYKLYNDGAKERRIGDIES